MIRWVLRVMVTSFMTLNPCDLRSTPTYHRMVRYGVEGGCYVCHITSSIGMGYICHTAQS